MKTEQCAFKDVFINGERFLLLYFLDIFKMWFLVAINGISFWWGLNDEALKLLIRGGNFVLLHFLEKDKMDYKMNLFD